MKISVETPHRRVVAYLLFWAGSPDAAMAQLMKRQLGYLYTLPELWQEIKAMRATMPTELCWWHESLPDGALLPPQTAEVEQWLDRWEIRPFCEQLLRRNQEGYRYDDDFHGAWDIFQNYHYRMTIEAFRIFGMGSAEIYQRLSRVGWPVTVAGIEIYLSLFYVIADYDMYELESQLDAIDRAAKRHPDTYKAEARAKRIAMRVPPDLHAVLQPLGLMCLVDNEVLLIEMTQRGLIRHSIADNAQKTGRTSLKRLDIEARIGNKQLESAKLLTEIMKNARDLGISRPNQLALGERMVITNIVDIEGVIGDRQELIKSGDIVVHKPETGH